VSRRRRCDEQVASRNGTVLRRNFTRSR
jgi:hypothetical protein